MRRPLKERKWYEEISEYLGLPPELVAVAGADIRDEDNLVKVARTYGDMGSFLKQREAAKQAIRDKFPPIGAITGIGVTEGERKSGSWQDNILTCIWAERIGYERIGLFEQVVAGVIAPKLKSRRKLRVLDYGCGTSLFSRYLAEILGPSLEIILCDIDGYHFRFAQHRLRSFTSDCLFFPIQDVRKVDFDFGPLDLIYCYAVFEHLPDVKGVIENFLEHLNPGGILTETYTGESGTVPHKSDTFNAYENRDHNLDYLRHNMKLVYGRLPKRKVDGGYENSGSVRFWIRSPYDGAEYRLMRSRLTVSRITKRTAWRFRQHLSNVWNS